MVSRWIRGDGARTASPPGTTGAPRRHGGGARPELVEAAADRSAGFAPPDPYADLKYRIHERLIKELDLQRFAVRAAGPQDEVRAAVEESAGSMLAGQDVVLGRQERLAPGARDRRRGARRSARWSRCCRTPPSRK